MTKRNVKSTVHPSLMRGLALILKRSRLCINSNNTGEKSRFTSTANNSELSAIKNILPLSETLGVFWLYRINKEGKMPLNSAGFMDISVEKVLLSLETSK